MGERMFVYVDAELLDTDNIGPLYADGVHEITMRADAGDTHAEMQLRSIEQDQEKLGVAYAENVAQTIDEFERRLRLNIEATFLVQKATQTERNGNCTEEATLALARSVIEVGKHQPPGHEFACWAIWKYGVLVFEL